ncbi:MAG: hypothetical protein PHV74_11620 [Dehalococcoidia bacterium]|nr:hypothetical protein [Dehalococcoidia bacterium]
MKTAAVLFFALLMIALPATGSAYPLPGSPLAPSLDAASDTASSNSPVCLNDTIRLRVAAVGVNLQYSWKGPNGFTSKESSPSIPKANTSMSGVYTVTVSDMSGISYRFSTTVTVTVDCVRTDKEAGVSIQPRTLDEAVSEVKRIIGRPRWEVAQRVATIADLAIRNLNDQEEIKIWQEAIAFVAQMAKLGTPLDPQSIFWSEQQRLFNNWRDNMGGAETTYTRAAQWVWNVKAGQCAENAALVYYLLKEAGEEDILIFTSPTGRHQFVVWGLGDRDIDKLESWTNDVVIPDSWQHLTLRGEMAAQNRHCAGAAAGKSQLSDQTYNRDPTACGYVGKRKPGQTDPGTSCCQKISPCRNKPGVVCGPDQHCYLCGQKDEYCCEEKEGQTPCAAGLVCKDGKCVEEEITTAPPGNCQALYDACCNEQVRGLAMPKITCGLIFSDAWCGRPGYTACAQAAFQQYLACMKGNGDSIACDQQLQTAIDACRK